MPPNMHTMSESVQVEERNGLGGCRAHSYTHFQCAEVLKSTDWLQFISMPADSYYRESLALPVWAQALPACRRQGRQRQAPPWQAPPWQVVTGRQEALQALIHLAHSLGLYRGLKTYNRPAMTTANNGDPAARHRGAVSGPCVHRHACLCGLQRRRAGCGPSWCEANPPIAHLSARNRCAGVQLECRSTAE